MCSWLAWERDDDHLGKEVAAEWREIIQKATLAAERDEPSECMDYCQIIADCITGNPITQTAIRNFYNTDPGMAAITERIVSDAIDGGRLPLSKREGPLVVSKNCNLNKMYSQVNELVDVLHDSVIDMFQGIEVLTNPAERAERVIAAIPVLGIFPIDEIIGFADALIDDVWEEYSSAFTETLRDKLKCDIFCNFKSNCGFSLEGVTSWYVAKVNGLVSGGDPGVLLQAFMEYVIAGNVTGPLVPYAMHTLMLALIRSGEAIAGIDFNRMALRIAAKADEELNDWQTLCTDCNITCTGTWPNPITFHQGSITNKTGEVYSVSLVVDPVPGYNVIRSSAYGTWTKGSFLLKKIEIVGATPFQIYLEGPTGTVIYNGTSATAANLLLPACVRYVQFVKHTSTGAFSTKLTIVT